MGEGELAHPLQFLEETTHPERGLQRDEEKVLCVDHPTSHGLRSELPGGGGGCLVLNFP